MNLLLIPMTVAVTAYIVVTVICLIIHFFICFDKYNKFNNYRLGRHDPLTVGDVLKGVLLFIPGVNFYYFIKFFVQFLLSVAIIVHETFHEVKFKYFKFLYKPIGKNK